MEYRTLELKVISAKDLKNVNLISKMNVYAVVWISGGDPNANQMQKTAVDRNGNTSPTWNSTLMFTVEELSIRNNLLAVAFRLRCERSLGDKDIGEVHVPFAELVGSIDDGKLQFVTYQVRKPSGKAKGELNISYKWGEKIVGPIAPQAMQVKSQEPVMSYPAQIGASSAYPPPPQGYGYPPPGGYPPAPGYGYYPPPPPQYGAYPHQPPPPGYGYPPPVQQPQKNSRMGLGLGAGLLGGALGGLLIGDMISDGGGFGGGCGGGGCGVGGCGGG